MAIGGGKGMFGFMLMSVALAMTVGPSFAHAKVPPEMEHAEQQFKRHHDEEAKQIIFQFINNHNNERGYLQLGALFSRLGRWSEAVHYYEVASTRNPSDYLVWYELGLAQHQNNQVDDSINSLRSSLKLSRKNKKLKSASARTIFAMGEILELVHDHYEARQIYGDGLQILGPQQKLYAKLCWLNAQDSFFQETMDNCRRALKGNPNDSTSAAILAKILYDQRKPAEAFKLLEAQLKRHPNNELLYRVRGYLYFQDESYEQAAASLGKAFGLDPMDDEAGVLLGRSLFKIKNYRAALPVYFETCELNHNYRFEMATHQRELESINAQLSQQWDAALDRL